MRSALPSASGICGCGALFLDPRAGLGSAGLGSKAALTSGRWPVSNAEIVVTPVGGATELRDRRLCWSR
ncbi:MAG: hypothetical protein V9G19_15180 [Tetrasphaera sp.]